MQVSSKIRNCIVLAAIALIPQTYAGVCASSTQQEYALLESDNAAPSAASSKKAPAAKSVTLPEPDSIDAAAASVKMFPLKASSDSPPPYQTPREKNADDVNQAKCPICIDDENMVIKADTNAIGCPCGQYFHKDCLRGSLVSGNWSCPTCRTDIKRYNGDAAEARIHAELFEHRKTQVHAQVMDILGIPKDVYNAMDDIRAVIPAAVNAEFGGHPEVLERVLGEIILSQTNETMRRRVLQQPANRQLLARSKRLTNRLVAAKTSRSA